MAFDLLRSAKHIRGLSNAEFRVLFYLLEAANNTTHECFPSIKKVAAFTDMAERTVQRHISALADRGLFERIEQRRADGSRAVNCYRFIVAGTIKVGRESVIQIEPEEQGDWVLDQPARNGGLADQQPAILDTTPRRDWRDIDQESEPGFSPSPSNEGEAPHGVNVDLLGDPVRSPEQEKAEEDEALIAFFNERWKALVAGNDGRISDFRALNDGRRKAILARGTKEVWQAVFDQIDGSRFLRGLSPPGPGRSEPMTVTIDWLLKPANFDKTFEGNFRDKRALSTDFDAASGRRLTAVEQASRNVADRLRASREQRGGGFRSRRDDAGAPQLVDGRARRD